LIWLLLTVTFDGVWLSPAVNGRDDREGGVAAVELVELPVLLDAVDLEAAVEVGVAGDDDPVAVALDLRAGEIPDRCVVAARAVERPAAGHRAGRVAALEDQRLSLNLTPLAPVALMQTVLTPSHLSKVQPLISMSSCWSPGRRPRTGTGCC
jgi:hypothetical protein